MQDQHFMQQWNAGHARFSEDFDRLARKVSKAIAGLRGGQPNGRGNKDKGPAPQEAPLARKARLTGIGIVAGVLAGSSLAMVTPLVTALDCPQHANQVCVRAALA